MKWHLFIALSILNIGSIAIADLVATPASRPVEPTPQTDPSDPREILRVKFIRHAPEISAEHRIALKQAFTETTRRYSAAMEALKGQVDKTVSAGVSFAKTEGGTLSLEGGPPPGMLNFILAGSDDSALIVSRLVEQKVLRINDSITQILRSCPGPLGEKWEQLLTQWAAAEKPDSKLLPEFLKILYSKGQKPGKYEAQMVALVRNTHDPDALALLLFRTNENGQAEPVVCSSNLALMRETARKGNAPELRTCAARYAAAVRDLTLAEEVCFDLLDQPFAGMVADVKDPPDEDYALARARDAALATLFYEVANSRAFDRLYQHAFAADLADRTALLRGAKLPPPGLNTYGLGRLEIQTARHYMNLLNQWKKEVKDGASR